MEEDLIEPNLYDLIEKLILQKEAYRKENIKLKEKLKNNGA